MKKKVLFISATIFILFANFVCVSALSVVVHVPEKYSEVEAGERFYFDIEIKYPENPERKDLKLDYKIFDEEGNLIAQSKVLKAVETQSSFIDFIIIPESTKKGLYTIEVGIEDYEELSESVQASFHVANKTDQLKIYFYILVAIIILVGVVISWEVHKLKK